MSEDDVTVLIVDDDSDLASLYAAWLAESYEVRIATNGREALELIDDSVDIALLDRQMPGMTGGEVLELIRERGIGCQAAMVTAVQPNIDTDSMSFDDYVTKPIYKRDLRSAVEALTQKQESDRTG